MGLEIKKIQEGDHLLWVSGLDNPASKKGVVVEKIGRKWLTIKNSWRGWKVDIDTLKVGGDRGYGHCFRSEEDLTAAIKEFYRGKAADKAWGELQKKTRETWKRPENLTEESILQAIAILGWDSKTSTT